MMSDVIPSSVIPMQSAKQYLSEFVRANGQIIINQTRPARIIYPEGWIAAFPSEREKYEKEALCLASSDEGFEGYTLSTGTRILGITEKMLLEEIRFQRIGAVQKYRRWYLHRVSFQQLIDFQEGKWVSRHEA